MLYCSVSTSRARFLCLWTPNPVVPDVLGFCRHPTRIPDAFVSAPGRRLTLEAARLWLGQEPQGNPVVCVYVCHCVSTSKETKKQKTWGTNTSKT